MEPMSSERPKRRRVGDVTEASPAAAAAAAPPAAAEAVKTEVAAVAPAVADAVEAEAKVVVPKTEPAVAEVKTSIAKLLTVNMHMDDRAEVAGATDKLKGLLKDSKEKSLEAIGLGGHSTIFVIMRKWIEDDAIQAGCCGCIANLVASLPDKEVEKVTTAFLEMEAAEHIVTILHKFPENRNMQYYGIAALGNLFTSKKNKTTKAAAIRFVNDLQGGELIVKIMKSLPDDQEIQSWGCWLLCQLTLFKERKFKKTLLKSGALIAVSEAKTKFSNSQEINDGCALIAGYLCGRLDK